VDRRRASDARPQWLPLEEAPKLIFSDMAKFAKKQGLHGKLACNLYLSKYAPLGAINWSLKDGINGDGCKVNFDASGYVTVTETENELSADILGERIVDSRFGTLLLGINEQVYDLEDGTEGFVVLQASGNKAVVYRQNSREMTFYAPKKKKAAAKKKAEAKKKAHK